MKCFLAAVVLPALIAGETHKRTATAPDVFDMFTLGAVEGGVAARVNILRLGDRMLQSDGKDIKTVKYDPSQKNGAEWIYNPSWKIFLNNYNNQLGCLDAFKGGDGKLYVHTYACAKWDPNANQYTANNQLWDADPLSNYTMIKHSTYTGYCLSQSDWGNAVMAPCNTKDPSQFFELRDVPAKH
uniref:Secreted protein n=1 Tax=Thraustotheca clavata TaxID=74557 RepID=A0A0A7CMB8_9STRA|nr:secreted protein [Thraustotheca clavata]